MRHPHPGHPHSPPWQAAGDDTPAWHKTRFAPCAHDRFSLSWHGAQDRLKPSQTASHPNLPSTVVFRPILLVLIALCALMVFSVPENHRSAAEAQARHAVAMGFQNLGGVHAGHDVPQYLPAPDSDPEGHDNQEHAYSGDDYHEADNPLPAFSVAFAGRDTSPWVARYRLTRSTDPVFRVEHPPKSLRA